MKAQLNPTAARPSYRLAIELVAVITAGIIGFGIGQFLPQAVKLPLMAETQPMLLAPPARDQWYREAPALIVQPAVRDQYYAEAAPTIDQRARETGFYYTSQYAQPAPQSVAPSTVREEWSHRTAEYAQELAALRRALSPAARDRWHSEAESALTIDERALETGYYYTSQYAQPDEVFVAPGLHDDWKLKR
jgi:hypothetical protein